LRKESQTGEIAGIAKIAVIAKIAGYQISNLKFSSFKSGTCVFAVVSYIA